MRATPAPSHPHDAQSRATLHSCAATFALKKTLNDICKACGEHERGNSQVSQALGAGKTKSVAGVQHQGVWDAHAQESRHAGSKYKAARGDAGGRGGEGMGRKGWGGGAGEGGGESDAEGVLVLVLVLLLLLLLCCRRCCCCCCCF